jgi:hypothetical protein
VAVELGDMPLAAVRRWQVQAFVNELADSGLSVRRLRAIVAGLRAFYLYAIEEGVVRGNPVDGVLVPTADRNSTVLGEERRPFTTTDQLEAVKTGGGNDQMIPDQMLWQFVKVATVIFVLIALVLVAESV